MFVVQVMDSDGWVDVLTYDSLDGASGFADLFLVGPRVIRIVQRVDVVVI